MNDGDVHYYSGTGGSSTLELTEDDSDSPPEFVMSVASGASTSKYSVWQPGRVVPDVWRSASESSTYGYSDDESTVYNYGESAEGVSLSFDPAWAILTDDLLEKGGSLTSEFTTDGLNVVATVTVSSAGTVEVPVGSYANCKSVHFTVKSKGKAVSAQAFTLAPYVGIIKVGVLNASTLQVAGYQSLTGGTVDGTNVALFATPAAPKIVTQPKSQAVVSGGTASFSVSAAESTAPITYQWKLNGIALSDSSNVSGSATSVLTIQNAGSGDAGKYTVVVSNAKGSVTSAAGTLTLEIPPAIVTQPVEQNVIAKHAAVFTVKASGSTPFAYRWYFNGEPLSNGHGVSGATSAKLVIDASASLEGYYSVDVENGVGSAGSEEVYLSVQSPPSIVSRPVSQTLGAGARASFSVDADGTGPLTYQWKRAGVDLTDGATYQGTATDTLIITNVQTAEAGAYEVVINNAVGSVTSPKATLTVDQPPTIASQPTNQTVAAGATAAFAVKAAGTGPLHYQWRFNGNNLANSASLSGATTAKLTLRKVQAASAGAYTVLVTNRVGQVVSTNAVLTISGAATTELALQSDSGATSRMSLMTASSQPVFTAAQILPGGAFQFTILAGSAQALIIQSSTSLQPGSWVNVSTNAVVNGQVTFTDANAGQAQTRFYRAVAP
jgi:hypothetical protein